jgi:RimJ/RimL family protein N-acetyltransferase
VSDVGLETPRLILRPLREDDAEALHTAVYGDPAVTWDGTAVTLEDTRAAVAAKVAHHAERGFGMLAVIDRADGSVLGFGGLQHLEGGPEVEVGYYLARRAWGRGLGTEIARAAVGWGFRMLGLERIVAVVRPGNAASKGVLAKAGLRFDHRAHHYGEDVEVWAVDRGAAVTVAVGASSRGHEHPAS